MVVKKRFFRKIDRQPKKLKTAQKSDFVIRRTGLFKMSKVFHQIKFRFPLTKRGFHLLKNTLWQLTSFVLLLLLYLTVKGLSRLVSFRLAPRRLVAKLQPTLSRVYLGIIKILDGRKEETISRIDLIELSIRNMRAKWTRSVVTIGGMAIGIGAIVFLVSLGYGLQQLVINRVVRLEEMRQADVAPQAGGKVKINDETLSDFKEITNVEMVLPLIAVVGRVNYQNSVSDMAVYGVTTDHLKQSAIKPILGEIFDSNELVSHRRDERMDFLEAEDGQIAGLTTETAKAGEKIQEVDFTINPGEWLRVREKPNTSSEILGYTKRTEGVQTGEEVWGGNYDSDDGSGEAGQDEDGSFLGKWIKAPVFLWKKGQCEEGSDDCEDGKFMVLRDSDGVQLQKTGYFAEINLSLTGTDVVGSKVLGLASESAPLEQTTATDSSLFDWVEIASEAGIVKPPETKKVSLASSAKKQAVVNRAMLKVLGITGKEAITKKFSVSFVVVGDLLEDAKEKVESVPEEYTIVGIVPEERVPFFYVPFIDLRSLGITNYSQVKVVVKDQTILGKVRRQIEAMGYLTNSVADTVAQINSLFITVRMILALLGMVALAVASLGMFNTLTVSLLERTREVGLMKAMGMKSSEVQELFLTESMVMGFFGGILGLILGFLAGKTIGVLLSLFALFKGAGLVDVAYVPPFFVLVVILLSLLVGVATGIYPARRATKISALDALRYE